MTKMSQGLRTAIDLPGRYLAVSFGLVVLLLMSACAGGTRPHQVPPQPATEVRISPSSVSVEPSETVQFTATVLPSGTIQGVKWSFANFGDCMDFDCGTLDSSGKYTAPLNAGQLSTVRVQASADADSGVSAVATITLLAPADSSNNASFHGRYAILLGVGFDNALDGRQALGAAITADGNGNISGICDDASHSMRAGNAVGKYAVGADYRAGVTITCGNVTRKLRVAFATPEPGEPLKRGQIIQLGYPEQDLSAGLIARQDPTAFSAAALAGNYAFGLGPLIGRFTAAQDDTSQNMIKSGQLDLQFGDFTLRNITFAGEFKVDSQGRGTLTLHDLPGIVTPKPFLPVLLSDLLRDFSFYVISKDELVLLPMFSTGCCPVGPAVSVGLALRQSGLPLASDSLSGPAALLDTRSAQESGLEYLAARVEFDGKGAFIGSGDRFTGGFDVGGVHEENVPVAGIYSLSPDGLGRGSITVNGKEMPLYVVRPGKAFLAMDSLPALLESQIDGPFSSASLAGDYAMGSTMPPFWGRVTGVLHPDGTGTGDAVVDGFTGPITGQDSRYEIGRPATAAFSTNSNGRTTVVLTGSDGNHWEGVFYLLSPSKAVGIWTHASGAAVLER